jgi:hypothetical protein
MVTFATGAGRGAGVVGSLVVGPLIEATWGVANVAATGVPLFVCGIASNADGTALRVTVPGAASEPGGAS